MGLSPSEASKKAPKIGDVVHAAVFVALLWLPLVVGLLRRGDCDNLAENRAAAELPRLGVDPIAAVPEKFESYYNDHFGLRDELIRAHHLVKVRALGLPHSTQVAVGKDDWLFFVGEGAIEDHQGLQPLSSEELAAWQEALEGKQAWLAQRGIAYLFVVAPNKESIYPELLPNHLQRVLGPTRLEQLVEHLRRHSTVEILDLRPVLREARQSGEVYYPLDTHWNHRGAMVAYQAICRRLQERFPDIQPLGVEDFRVVEGIHGGDLCPMVGWHGASRGCELLLPRRPAQARPAALDLDPSHAWPQQTDGRCAAERPGSTRRLLMFHDSFVAQYVREYVVEHFGRSVCLWMRPDFEALSILVERERPDVVVEQRVERGLCVVPTPHPSWTAARLQAATLRR